MHIHLGRWLSYFGGVLVILVILGSIAYAMLPSIVKWQANGWFEDQNLVSQIDDVEINITDGEFIVRDFSVKEKGGEKRLNIGLLLLRMGIRDLFSNKLSVEKLEISDVFVDVEQQQDGIIKVGGIGAGSPSSETDVTEEKPAETKEKDLWHISLTEMLLRNFELCFRAAERESSRAFHDCIRFDSFIWNGSLAYTLYPDSDRALSELRVAFNTSLSGFSIDDEQLKRTVMRFDGLNFNDVAVNGVNDTKIKTMLLTRYQALQAPPVENAAEPSRYLLSSDQLSISDVQFKDLALLDINTVRLNGLNAAVLIDANGGLEIQKVIKSFTPESKEAKKASEEQPEKEVSKEVAEETTKEDSKEIPKEAEKEIKTEEAKEVVTKVEHDRAVEEQEENAEAMVVRLGELIIDGSSINIRDESVKPVFENKISDIRLSVKEVDMSKVDGETLVDLSMVFGEHGKFDTSGKVRMFAEKPTVDMVAKLVGVNVGEFDAYTKQLVQHKVKSGHLDGDFKIRIDKGNLDTKATVKLHKFYVETLDEKESSHYKEKLGVPLGSALALLRDKDDSISIKMPIKGDVENPDFSLGDIIRKVSAIAIKEAVINYYTPFGLVKLLSKGFDLATALRFEPVVFNAGDATLDQQDKGQLEKIAKLMNERPGVHLVVCGYATQKDFNHLYPEESEKIKKLLNSKEKENESSETVAAGVGEKVEIPILDQQQKKMDELAGLRGKVVKQYLVEQFKIGTNRLISCNPKFDFTDEGKMRTEITI